MSKKVLIRAAGIQPLKKNEYRSGVPRSNVELLKALIALNDDNLDFSIYCPTLKSPFYHCQDWPVEHYWYGLPGKKYHCKLEPWWREHFMGKHDLVHLTENADYFGKDEKFVVTIHDTDIMNRGEYETNLFINCAKHSRGIITCSEYSKIDIIEKLRVPEKKVTVAYWGISNKMFYPRSKDEIILIKKKFNINGDYFFACSCSHKRKNADIILEAFKQFVTTDNSTALVIALSNPPMRYIELYSELISSRRLIFVPFVSDEELPVLYSGALASILVSSLEGFGFPILESMACGTNCICCKNSSMTEIGSDKAFFVKHRDIDDLASAFLYFSKHGKGNIGELISYAKQFTWEKTAKQYIDFYKSNIY